LGQLRRGAVARLPWREDIGAAHDSKQLVNAPVRSSVRLSRKPHLSDRTESGEERGDYIGCPFTVRNQTEHRVLGHALLIKRVLWVRNHESARASESRVIVTCSALVAVKASSQPRGVGLCQEIGLGRIHGLTGCEIGAVVADRLQLYGALQTLLEHGQFDGSQAIERFPGTRRAPADAGVALRKADGRGKEQQCGDNPVRRRSGDV
jgi:hypothetical protein